MKLKLQSPLFTVLWTLLLLLGVSAGVLAQAAPENTLAAGDSKILAVSAKGLTFHSTYTDITYNIPSNVKALGVDVSFWQQEIDWEAVAADGIDFAMIRAAGRDSATGVITTDSWFAKNIKGAQAAGIKVGVYIFSQAITVKEAEAEAAYILDLLAGYHLDLPVVMDYEFRSGHTGRLAEANLTKTAATSNVLAFCDYVSSRGYIPMLYANTDMLNNYLNKDDILTKVELWYARYGDTPYLTGFALWQYSNSGKVNGIKGNADCNFSFVDLAALGNPFDDVSQGKWYFEAVLYAYRNGLFTGVSPHTFAPAEAMSRGMLVTVLHRLEGAPAVGGGTAFADVKAGSWYEMGVNWAEQNGIVNGVSANRFNPDADLTREQIAAMLYRYSQYKGYDVSAAGTLANYTDGGSVSPYAVTAMEWAVASGYLRGVTAQTLCPQESADRAQVATVLHRFCEDHTEIQ